MISTVEKWTICSMVSILTVAGVMLFLSDSSRIDWIWLAMVSICFMVSFASMNCYISMVLDVTDTSKKYAIVNVTGNLRRNLVIRIDGKAALTFKSALNGGHADCKPGRHVFSFEHGKDSTSLEAEYSNGLTFNVHVEDVGVHADIGHTPEPILSGDELADMLKYKKKGWLIATIALCLLGLSGIFRILLTEGLI